MKYAPVIIPTLCRDIHLKRCLELLSANKYANLTDIIIALDYPSKKIHWSGHLKIQSFLETSSFNFKSLTVIKRNYNYGPLKNTNDLIDYVLKRYDNYIFTEDDNVFSQNFLEYINCGLELYKDNSDVIGICGYNYNILMDDVENNSYFSHEYSAWGVGRWKSKSSSHYISKDYLKKIVSSYKLMYEIFKQEPRLINTLIYTYKSDQLYADTMTVCYQYLTKKVSLFPKLSLVRNYGFDKSGSSINKKDYSFDCQKIDQSVDFRLEEQPIIASNIGMKYVKKYWKRSPIMNFAILVRVIVLSLIKIDIFYYIDKLKHNGNIMFK